MLSGLKDSQDPSCERSDLYSEGRGLCQGPLRSTRTDFRGRCRAVTALCGYNGIIISCQ